MLPALPDTVAQLWGARVAATPGALAFESRVDGQWTAHTWRQCDARVRRLAAGLVALGVVRGDRVAILASTRLEWVLCDFAAMCTGAVVTTIYPSSTPDECVHILGDSGAVACIAEDAAQLAKLESAVLPDLVHRVVIDGEGADSLTALEERGAVWLDADPGAFEAHVAAVQPDDLATLIYTSGTTGTPKGVMLTHAAWMFQAATVTERIAAHMEPGDKQYLFLPLAHSFGKICELIAVAAGSPTAIDGDIDGLVAGLQATRPTLMAAVPRVFEKIYDRTVARALAAGPRRYAVFRWAVAVGDRAARLELAGRPLGAGLRLQRRIAQRLVFRRLRQALGGRMRAFVSGGAPLSEDLARFFYAAGMRVLEGYGLTETSAGAVANTFDDFRFGTVGRPFPGTEVRISSQGEVWLRGPHLMRGYWNRPDDTAEAIDADGWLRTGDLGTLDAEGRLSITGRIKDILITAGGKNIAPQPIESRIKATSPLIEEVVMYGDRRPYCVALVHLDLDATRAWAERHQLSGLRDRAALAAHPEVRQAVWADVAAVNVGLPSYATIKRVAVLQAPLSVEGGELTPSMKVKRAVLATRHQARIDGLYESNGL